MTSLQFDLHQTKDAMFSRPGFTMLAQLSRYVRFFFFLCGVAKFTFFRHVDLVWRQRQTAEHSKWSL